MLTFSEARNTLFKFWGLLEKWTKHYLLLMLLCWEDFISLEEPMNLDSTLYKWNEVLLPFLQRSLAKCWCNSLSHDSALFFVKI